MTVAVFRRGIAAVAFLSGLLLIPALPAQAVSAGPRVIAVHRNGAIDVPGNSTLGTIAKMSVPAGNWSLTATATVIGTASLNRVECQLIAGSEFYKSRTLPSSQGAASYGGMVLLLAHHFAKKGTASLQCYSDGWLGDALIRDVHLTAVQVGQLSDNGTTTGTGGPKAVYAQNTSPQIWTNTSYNDVQVLAIPPGKWLVQATAWGESTNDGDRVDCRLNSSLITGDQSFGTFELFGGERSLNLEGVFTIPGLDEIDLACKDTDASWAIAGSAMSAIQVGTLTYGQLGGAPTTTGSGSPTVVGSYGGPGGISDATSLQQVASMSLGAGSWWVTSKLSIQAGSATKVTCQVQVSGATDQARLDLDTSNNIYGWMGMSLTRTLSAKSHAVVACNQSDGSLGAGYFDLQIFALKAGSLTDTDLD